MKQKKNKLFTFVFSLLPGAGEMYMGFMKQGISLMSIFFACIYIGGALRFEFALFASIVVWCYSFFHVHNLRSMSDEDFRVVEDKIINPLENTDIHFNITNKKVQMVIAIALIIYGADKLWHYITDLLYLILPGEYYARSWSYIDNFPEAFLAVIIIWFGIRLIKGKKMQLEKQEATQRDIGLDEKLVKQDETSKEIYQPFEKQEIKQSETELINQPETTEKEETDKQ